MNLSMQKAKEADFDERFPGNVPEVEPSDRTGEHDASQVDEQIRDLETKLEEFKKIKEEERLAQLSEIQEVQARAAVPDKYKQLAKKQVKRGVEPGQPDKNPEKLSVLTLNALAPEDAVASLVQLATTQKDGLEKAIGLVRQVAQNPGGAWILDQFHLRMTQSKK